MGVDFQKCDGCHECLNTQCFPDCFCCRCSIDGLCCDCIEDINCFDTTNETYLCNLCLCNATYEDLESGADSYGVLNVNKIIKVVKRLRKTHFTKEWKIKQLTDKIDRCKENINNLQRNVLKYEKQIKELN